MGVKAGRWIQPGRYEIASDFAPLNGLLTYYISDFLRQLFATISPDRSLVGVYLKYREHMTLQLCLGMAPPKDTRISSTRASGRPTTLVYDPSIEPIMNAPRPWMA